MRAAGFIPTGSQPATERAFHENPGRGVQACNTWPPNHCEPTPNQDQEILDAMPVYAQAILPGIGLKTNRHYELNTTRNIQGRINRATIHEYKKPD